MESLLVKQFGKVLSVCEVANYLDISEKTVCRNYEKLGGIRLCDKGKIIFFEKLLVQSINQKIKNKSSLAFSVSGEFIEDRHNLLA